MKKTVVIDYYSAEGMQPARVDVMVRGEATREEVFAILKRALLAVEQQIRNAQQGAEPTVITIDVAKLLEPVLREG
jgi:hypothetical protein